MEVRRGSVVHVRSFVDRAIAAENGDLAGGNDEQPRGQGAARNPVTRWPEIPPTQGKLR
jgi:hypothetical protein